VRSVGPAHARAYARSHAVDVGAAASFQETDAQPGGIEMVLAALGADLVNALEDHARRRGIGVDGIEITLTAELDNPLVLLGVVGETGDPGIARIEGVLYLGLDAEPDVAEDLWRTVRARSPLHATLARACALSIELRLA
jgi:hypothetical protein